MMRILFFLLGLSVALCANDIEHFGVKNHNFTILKESYDLYNSKGKSMKIYREESDEDLHFLMTFVLEDKSGGCSGKSIQEGTYKIEADKITFYTSWDRQGDAKEEPFGARKEVYKIGRDGKMHLLKSQFYIEDHARKKHDKSGMQYLFTPPVNADEKALLQAYVTSMQNHFKGEFMLDDAAVKLQEEVQKALHQTPKSVWKNRN